MGIMEYANSSYASDLEDKKLITRYGLFLDRVIITWCNKRHHTISKSNSKVEYMAVSQCAKKDMWIRQLLKKLPRKEAIKQMMILSNNKISLILTRDLENQNLTKYIDVMLHHVRGLVENEQLIIDWIESSKMLADGLINVLLAVFLKRH